MDNACTSCFEGYKLETTGIISKCVRDSNLNLPVRICGKNKILGCETCSEVKYGYCRKCLSGTGLVGYISDYSAGKGCVICPFEACEECDMKEGEEVRRCRKCKGNKQLMEDKNGRQWCFGHFLGNLLGRLILVFLGFFVWVG